MRSAAPPNYESIPRGDQSVDVGNDGSAGAPGKLRRTRSQLAHALLVSAESEAELQHLPPAASAKMQFAINLSLVVNIILTITKIYAAIVSSSLAVLSSLVDSILDLASQWLFWYSDSRMHTPHVNYPAGRRRLEPVVVIVAAALMGMASLEVVQKSIEALVEGINGSLPEIDMTPFAIISLVVTIVVKVALWWLCARLAKNSPSADALAQDHRNDVFSNTVALVTSVIAYYHNDLWYSDPVGAIAISVYIAYSWVVTGQEQVERLVGLRADPEFIEQIRELTNLHHPLMKADIVRAYHFGSNYLVELEVLLPETMSVRDSHDISLALQHKVEALDNVERAFVHVDYLAREYDEHKDPTIRHDDE